MTTTCYRCERTPVDVLDNGLGVDIPFCASHAPYSWLMARANLAMGRAVIAPIVWVLDLLTRRGGKA